MSTSDSHAKMSLRQAWKCESIFDTSKCQRSTNKAVDAVRHLFTITIGKSTHSRLRIRVSISYETLLNGYTDAGSARHLYQRMRVRYLCTDRQTVDKQAYVERTEAIQTEISGVAEEAKEGMIFS